MVMDAKALYDSLMSEQTNQDDERACLEVSIIKEDFQVLGCVPRWVPHDKNPSDALPKIRGRARNAIDKYSQDFSLQDPSRGRRVGGEKGNKARVRLRSSSQTSGQDGKGIAIRF